MQVKYGRSIGSASADLDVLAECPVWGRVDDDDLDTYRAVLTARPFEVDNIGPFLIRAAFTTAGGIRLDGSVSIDPPLQTVYMIDVWIGDVQFGFNWQLQEWAAEDLQKLAIQLGVPESSIFPVQFTTPVIGPDGITPFAGVFTPFVNIEQHWKQITQNIRGVLE